MAPKAAAPPKTVCWPQLANVTCACLHCVEQLERQPAIVRSHARQLEWRKCSCSVQHVVSSDPHPLNSAPTNRVNLQTPLALWQCSEHKPVACGNMHQRRRRVLRRRTTAHAEKTVHAEPSRNTLSESPQTGWALPWRRIGTISEASHKIDHFWHAQAGALSFYPQPREKPLGVPIGAPALCCWHSLLLGRVIHELDWYLEANAPTSYGSAPPPAVS